jgi:hypothetical protein
VKTTVVSPKFESTVIVDDPYELLSPFVGDIASTSSWLGLVLITPYHMFCSSTLPLKTTPNDDTPIFLLTQAMPPWHITKH